MCAQFENDFSGTDHTNWGRFWISMSSYTEIKRFVCSRENVKVKLKFRPREEAEL
jgi:succinate-acetate transporter protein